MPKLVNLSIFVSIFVLLLQIYVYESFVDNIVRMDFENENKEKYTLEEYDIDSVRDFDKSTLKKSEILESLEVELEEDIP